MNIGFQYPSHLLARITRLSCNCLTGAGPDGARFAADGRADAGPDGARFAADGRAGRGPGAGPE